MRVLLTVAALVAMVSAASVSLEDLEFSTWKLKFGKNYGSEEEESQRKMTWMTNQKLVLEHNLLADQGIKSYRLGMNQFADMSNQEYQTLLLSSLASINRTEDLNATPFIQQEDVALPASVDWRKEGYVTDVKNQKSCGSCWAFSATGALEAQMYKKTKRLISLSEQQLVDCSWNFQNHGCEGGWPARAFEYIKASKGLQADYNYPYKAMDGFCRFNPGKIIATCSGHKLVSGETALQNAVATVGPVTVAVDASKHTFQLYKSGVYNEPGCSSTHVNHAVLVVGYGVYDGRHQYWLVKNSWGVAWGDAGYIKMSRNKGNQCGIASHGSFPLV